jgi:hypothetical protein
MEPLARRGRAVDGRRVDDAQARGRPATAPQPDVLSAPTVLQREAKRPQPCASKRAPPTDAISGALGFADANPPTSTSRDHDG